MSGFTLGGVRNGQSADVLFLGSLETPAAGIWLRDEPTVLVHELGGRAGEGRFVEALTSDQRLTLSDDWRHAVLQGRTEDRDGYRISGGPRFFLEGSPRFVLATGSRPMDAVPEVLAVSKTSRTGVQLLRWLSSSGRVTHRTEVVGLLWASPSVGGPTALGTREGVWVVEGQDNERTQVFAGSSRLGALSSDGRRLVFEHEAEGGATLQFQELDPLSSPATAAVPRGRAILFDPSGTRIAHLSGQRVDVLAADVPLASAESLAVLPEWEWRDAAFATDGRLALSRIRVESRPRRDRRDPEHPFREGVAIVGVDLFSLGSGAPEATVEWSVGLWNRSAPELAFAEDGRLFCFAWPSAYEIRLP